MSNDPKQPQQVYGFAVDRPLLWPKLSDDPRPNPPDREGDREQREKKALAEVVETIKEAATVNPRVGREIIRILDESKPAPAPPARPATPSGPSAAPVRNAPPAASPQTAPPQSPPAPRRRRKRIPPPPRPMSPLQRHKSQCSICGASDQDQIEEAFLDWECVTSIAREFNIDRRAIYRHSHATGLFARRDLNIRRALGHLIHEADRVTVSADSIVRAVRLFAHINARGEWVQPPTQVVFTSAMAVAAANAAASSAPAEAAAARTLDVPATVSKPRKSSPKLPSQGDTPCKAKSRVTRTKQMKATHAGRHTFSKPYARTKGLRGGRN